LVFIIVISPLLQKLSSKHLKLTFSEIRIANMIKLAKLTKEIATYLGVSDKTIEFHRGSMRKKTGDQQGKS
jgi:DNA-binding CsgD family transcriptional regulator